MVTPAPGSAALQELAKQIRASDEAEQMYAGTTPGVIVSERLRRLFGGTGKHSRINSARTPVDAVLEWTLIQGVSGSNAHPHVPQTACAAANRICRDPRGVMQGLRSASDPDRDAPDRS